MPAGWSAIILAAGLGTRLRPLSSELPKPLFPLCNLPLLGLLLRQLEAGGCRRVAINLHYRAEQITAFLAANPPAGLEVHLSYEPEILGTGGVYRQLASFIGPEPALVLNGDIVTDLNLATLWEDFDPNAISTMILHDHPRFNRVWVDHQGYVTGFGPSPAPPVGTQLAFTGIQIITPRLLDWLPARGYGDIIEVYRRAIAAGDPPAARCRTGFFWQDIGTPADYLDLHLRLLQGALPQLAAFLPPLTDPLLGPGVEVEPGVTWGGGVCLGPQVRIGRGVALARTVVWAGAVIDAGVELTDCLVARGVRVRRSVSRACLTATGVFPWQ